LESGHHGGELAKYCVLCSEKRSRNLANQGNIYSGSRRVKWKWSIIF